MSISNFWKNTTIVCSKHEEETKMDIVMHTKGPFYECPVCHSKLSIYDFEKMINYFQDVLTEAYLNDEELDITNSTWKHKKNHYKVLQYKDEKMKVGADINE